jgi:flagellar biogenesis protein FliO
MNPSTPLANARDNASVLLRSRGLLVIAGAVGLLAGVVAAQSQGAGAPFRPTTPLVATAPPLDGNGQPLPGAALPKGQAANGALPGSAVEGSSGGARIVIMMTVLAGLGLAFMVMRKRQGDKRGKAAPAMSLIGQLRVAGRWQVALVKVPGKTLVLGTTDKGLSLLSTLEDGDVEAQAELAALDRKPVTDDLAALVGDDDRVNVRTPSRQGPPSDLLGALAPLGPLPPRTPLTEPRRSSEPFGRLLEELTRDTPKAAATTVTGPIPGAFRDRMKTPEAQALRARLERYQSPSA